MAKLTEEQLIGQIKTLKEIKPRKEWVSLLKSEILISNSKTNETKDKIENLNFGFWNLFRNFDLGFRIYSKRLVYAFATLAFVIVGLVGFARNTVPGDLLFPIKRLAEQSQASLTGQTKLSQDVANLNSRINDLAQVTKEGKKNSIPSAISEVRANASVLSKNLKDNPVKNQQTLKEIAASLKTLADVSGTDLTANEDVKDLYQTVVESQIIDLRKTSLTDEQKETLKEIEDLYNQEKYSEALEKILLINK